MKKRIAHFLLKTALASTCLLVAACASAPRVSPVYAALQKNPLNLSELEILAKEDVNAQAPDGNSCLYHAIVSEKTEAAKILAATGSRLSREELYALFEPYQKRKETPRFQFLSPVFFGGIVPYEAAVVPQRKYTCIAGDTISRIAQKLRCSEKHLRSVNPAIDFSRLKSGTKINVPYKD